MQRRQNLYSQNDPFILSCYYSTKAMHERDYRIWSSEAGLWVLNVTLISANFVSKPHFCFKCSNIHPCGLSYM